MIDRLARVCRTSRWGQVILLVVAYVALNRYLMRVSALPSASYEAPCIAVEAARSVGSRWKTLAPLILAIAVLAFRWRSLGVRWSGFSHGNALRALILTSGVLLAWTYSTYDYNYYHDRWHALDRVALVALLIPLWFRPIFVFPFLAVLVPIPGQFRLGPGWASWVPVDLPLNLVLLFAGFLFLALLLRWKESGALMFLCFALFGAQYWISGLAKLEFGWHWHDQVHQLLPASYAEGWLRSLSPEQIGSVTQRMARINPLMRGWTIFVECLAPLLLFIGPKTAGSMLVCFGLLHVGVIGFSGIFFWQWLVCLVCLGILLWRTPWHVAAVPSDRRRWHVMAGMLLVLLSPYWVRTHPLAWIDSNVKYRLRYEGVGRSGRVYALPARYFAPFEYAFWFRHGMFLTRDRQLLNAPSARAWALDFRTRALTTPEQLAALERECGTDQYRPAKRALLIAFMQRFATRVNADIGARKSVGILRAPPTLLRSSPDDSYRGEEPIVRINVHQEVWFFDGKRPRQARASRIVLEVPIPTR